MRRAADLVADFLAGLGLATYLTDPLLRSGVARPLEVVGEALHLLSRTDPALAARVPDLRRAVEVGAVPAARPPARPHAYAGADPAPPPRPVGCG